MNPDKKLYVIGEIEAYMQKKDEKTLYTFPGRPSYEYVWLADDSPALVRQSQLRYGSEASGKSRGFFHNFGRVELIESSHSLEPRLIIDPIDPHKPPESKSVWDRWLEECPVCDERVKAWIAQMPRSEEKQ